MLRFFRRNLNWKLLSLALSLLLWLVFIREPELATSVGVPVQFRGMPGDMEINSELPERVQLEIKGPSGQLTPENLTDSAVILDLGSVHQPGDRTYTISSDTVTLPSGVSFTRAVPSQIRLHFERRAAIEAPVKVRYSHMPPEGYVIVDERVEPDKLRVIGPQASVQEVSFVDTDSIDLSGVVAEAEFQVNTFIPNPSVRFESKPVVRVRVRVEKRR
ncbi:MAG: YbbR-like domain-containing protein [Bryobacteraceae bacterium]|nr:YbbR-like domain-containing protein [Bryobacteraceae bacterium]